MGFDAFFKSRTGEHRPYPRQTQLAEWLWPETSVALAKAHSWRRRCTESKGVKREVRCRWRAAQCRRLQVRHRLLPLCRRLRGGPRTRAMRAAPRDAGRTSIGRCMSTRDKGDAVASAGFSRCGFPRAKKSLMSSDFPVNLLRTSSSNKTRLHDALRHGSEDWAAGYPRRTRLGLIEALPEAEFCPVPTRHIPRPTFSSACVARRPGS